jgi:hypothetical protein
LVSGRKYAHVSISLDNKDEYFYAFNSKGFHKEYPRKHKNRTKNHVCYRLEVTKEQYEELTEIIHNFEKEKEKYHYNWIGIFLCIVGIPFVMKNRYFCSQFITDILQKAKVIKWNRNYCRYLPNRVEEEITQKCKIRNVVKNPLLKRRKN